MRQFYFEKLEVWQEAKSFVKEIYMMTSNFPADEKFGMVSQLRRSSTSICANIAEGMSRMTEKDKARFVNQAFSSAIEVLNFLILCQNLSFLKQEEYLI